LTASFLGAQTIQHTRGLGALTALALAALAVSIITCIYVLLPKRGFVFSMSGPRVYESLFEFAGDNDEVRRRLAYWLEHFWQHNQTKIDRLARFYALAAMSLTLQLLSWAGALASSLS
jgi:hypothetical protein